MENYLHLDAIRAVRPECNITFGDFDDVPMMVAEAVQRASESERPWDELGEEKKSEKERRAKKWLNSRAVEAMTPAMLDQKDPSGELLGWLNRIAQLIERQ